MNKNLINKLTSIKGMGAIFTGLLIAMAITLGISFIELKNETVTLQDEWHSFQKVLSPQSSALSGLYTQIGYGGAIHQFKNYVLRQDASRLQKFQRAVGGAQREVRRYLELQHSNDEGTALKNIDQVLSDYLAAMDVAHKLVIQGATPEQIDQQVKINDTPALEGLSLLSSKLNERNIKGITTKVDVLNKIRAIVGYGGIIHNFKNLVIRKDAPRLAKLDKQSKLLDTYFEQYRSFNLIPSELNSLDDIESVFRQYKNSLDNIRLSMSRGDSAIDIDRSVKISDSPALNGLQNLAMVINNETAERGKAVEQRLIQLGELESHIQLVSFVCLIILLILLFSMSMIIKVKILNPISSIQKFIRNLSKDFDLKQRYEVKVIDEIGQMALDLNIMLESFHGIVTQVASTSNHIYEVGETLSSASVQTKQAMQSQLSQAELTSDSMNEMTISFNNVVDNTQQTKLATQQALEKSEIAHQTLLSLSDKNNNTAKEIDESTISINQLEESSQEIGSIMDVIRGIADQTNLLALNAAIEAARAGEHGRGFAVVADEVRVLAARTQDNTIKIGKMTEAIQNGIKVSIVSLSHAKECSIEGVNQAKDMMLALDDIQKTTKDIANMTHQISQATEQQTLAAEKVNENYAIILTTANETLTGAEGIEKSNDTVMTLAGDLRNSIQQFRY